MQRLTPYLFCAILVISCSEQVSIARMKPLLGPWRTDRGVIVVISQTPEYGFAAAIKTAPGFLGGDMAPGALVVANIKARPDRTFIGDFLVPGDTKPIRITIMFYGQDRLVLGSGDKRVRGKMMIWTREARQ